MTHKDSSEFESSGTISSYWINGPARQIIASCSKYAAVTVLGVVWLSGRVAAAQPHAVMPAVVPLHSYGLLPEGCEVPPEFHDFIHFIGDTTQLLMIIGGVLLVAGYAFSGLYWIIAGPQGKQRAIAWVKHVTVGGLILVLAKPSASYILSSFSVFCGGGG